MKLANRIGAIVMLAPLLTNQSCTHHVEIPPHAYEEYSGDASRSVSHWRVHTTDDRIYAVARFSITDSTLVIEKFDSGPGAADSIRKVRTGLPYAIPLEEVAAVEKVETGSGAAIAVAALGTAAAAYLLFLAYLGALLGGLN